MCHMPTQQKIADALFSLSPAKAAETLQLLTEQEILKTGDAILLYAHKGTSEEHSVSDDITTVADSPFPPFLKTVAQQHSGLEVARALFRLAFGPRRASELISILLKRQVSTHFSFLSYYPVDQLFEVLKSESPQVVGFVLGVVDATVAAKLLRLFPVDIRPTIIMYVATHTTPNVSICTIISDTLHRKLRENAQRASGMEHPGGVECLEAILERLPFKEQERLISQCDDTSLQIQLQKCILNWDTINTLPDHAIKDIIVSMNYNDIALLVMLDGDDATRVIARGMSTQRLAWVQDEASILHRNASQIVRAQSVKNDFFLHAKQQLYVHEEVYI